MPAIQLARLKIQITELLTNFDRPVDFLRELHTLFGFYADRTRRPGQSGKPKPPDEDKPDEDTPGEKPPDEKPTAPPP